MIEGNHWLNETFFTVAVWKWLTLVAAFALGTIFFSAFRYAAKKLKQLPFFKKKHEGFWYYYVRLDLEGPLAWILLSLIWLFTIESLELPIRLDKYLMIAVKIILSVNIVRMVYVAMDAVGEMLKSYTAKTQSTLDDHLAPMAVKTAKLLVIILGVLIVLQNFGVNVMSLLAGLGLGGLALALAAQDAAANLIGSVMILLDRPFSIGDAVKVGDTEGTIESIGFRSTRIRTTYNSLVTIPNSTMAKDKIDNMGLRPYRRIRQVLGIHYDTPPELIEHFCTRVKYLISQEQAVMKDTIQVSFNGFADSTLNVLVIFHLEVFDIQDELNRQQKIFCEILAAAKEMGVIFAYPTQTVYYMQDAQSSNTTATQQVSQ
ncbi:mechanosensitive ion channel family protein [Bdellovibrio sp. HCB337]|uniref:mechanosensitive ion channel family protein n=1 Tax=Bdellovibrio sp. HCB337 TaxID=3394358 RepID=UPI0039A53A14